MAEETSVESLQALYADLIALSESRLSSLDRLGAALDAHMQDFKNLLDKKARSEQSRKSLATGKLKVSEDEYSVNDEFQQGALQLADELNLDELEAAKLFLQSQEETDSSGRPPLTNSVVRFHQRRKSLLDCLRLILQQSTDINEDEQLRLDLRAIVVRIIEPSGGSARFVQRCLSAMADIKLWLQRISEKLNSASVLGQGQQPDMLEMMEYQRISLVKQHESLSIMLLYLVEGGDSVNADFEQVLDTLKKADRYDHLLLHYFPALSAYISRFASMQAGATLAEAKTFNSKIFHQDEEKPWTLTYVHAAFKAWWLAEYSGWYGEHHDGTLPENQLEDESRECSKHFIEVLKDGAFDFLLSISADVKPVEWHDPARHGLRQWLQKKAPIILSDSITFSDFFQEALMDQFESFIEAFITNLPDVLRRLRVDEDEQRQLSKDHEHDLDLEKFIVIISYTFEGRPKPALERIWEHPDGVLSGFVHWVSRRASTPLVSAFCEMLQAISEDEECATSAHRFLIDDGQQSSGKIRRTHSLTWNQIFKELTFFSAKIRDRPAVPQAQTYRPGKPHIDLVEAEPESALMLESYLRLISQLCSESVETRNFLTHHPTFHISELLFQLTSSSIAPRLRACAFNTLRSLLSQKTKEISEYHWSALDIWISGGYSPGSVMTKPPSSTSMTTSAASMAQILQGLASGFEEPNAFVRFLHALVLPYNDESGLNDGLPFPENLGTSTRQPGIDPYVDFALGQIFIARSQEYNDVVQMRLLQLACLDFIATCLDTFNEDLVIFASQSNVNIDMAIKTSSLQNYVLLHPFSRVMEWMFNDKVMDALFATINQDPMDVARASPDSPLILCLLRGIHVVTSILELQSTYLDIIRPFIKLQPNYRRVPVSNSAFGYFEDGVLNHLFIIPALGRYCGTGHPEVVTTSLKLLERLSSSPRLALSGSSLGRPSERNKVLAALDDDAEAVSQILLLEMESTVDVNQGPESAEYVIKLQILDFLIACLKAAPDQPTVAHLLLGFHCSRDSLSVTPDGPFSRSTSLFHSILAIVLNAPLVDDIGISPLLVSLAYKALQVLKELWTSPLSSLIVLSEMRLNGSFFIMFAREPIIQSATLWDGLELGDSEFLGSASASCLSDFLCRRALILQYMSAELRQVMRSHSPSLMERSFETILGSTTAEDGQKMEHATILDLFDFMEIDFGIESQPPQLSWFAGIDLQATLDQYDDSVSSYDLGKVEELLVLKRSELTAAKRLENEQDIVLVTNQAQELLVFLAQDNQIKTLRKSRLIVLKALTQLTLVVIEGDQFDGSAKTRFILDTLQTIIPRLDSDLDVVSEAMELAKLAKALMFSLDFGADSFKQGNVSDRLFHLFQVSLRAINTLGTKVALKEYFFDISYRYLTGMSDISGGSGSLRKPTIQTIKSAGERLIDLICDDAHSGDPTCRIAALLVLGALVKLGKQENSNYIIESLARLNFIGIMVDSIQNIPSELHETPAQDVHMQLSYCHSRLGLLLQVSQTRYGAAAVLNSGLFHATRVSGLFNTDPDLGVDIHGPNAIEKHYELLTAIMRIISATVLVRGPQNHQTIDLGRRFLVENRLSVVAVLKKSAGLGVLPEISTDSIRDLADSFMLLISLTGFLDFEVGTTQQKQTQAFTAFT